MLMFFLGVLSHSFSPRGLNLWINGFLTSFPQTENGSHSHPPSSPSRHLQSYLSQSLWSYLTSTYPAWASLENSLLWSKPGSLQPLCICPGHSLLLKCPSSCLYLLRFYPSPPRPESRPFVLQMSPKLGAFSLSFVSLNEIHSYFYYNMLQSLLLESPLSVCPIGAWDLGDLRRHPTHLCNLQSTQPLLWWLIGLGVKYFVYK